MIISDLLGIAPQDAGLEADDVLRQLAAPSLMGNGFFEQDLTSALAEIESRASGMELRSNASSRVEAQAVIREAELDLQNTMSSSQLDPSRSYSYPAVVAAPEDVFLQNVAAASSSGRPSASLPGDIPPSIVPSSVRRKTSVVAQQTAQVTEEDRLAAAMAFEQLFGTLASTPEDGSVVDSNWERIPTDRASSNFPTVRSKSSSSKVSQVAVAAPPAPAVVDALAALPNLGIQPNGNSPATQRCPQSARDQSMSLSQQSFLIPVASELPSSHYASAQLSDRGSALQAFAEQMPDTPTGDDADFSGPGGLLKALAALQKESQALGGAINAWTALNVESGQHMASQHGIRSAGAFCGRSSSPQVAAQILQTETRSLEALLKTSDFGSSESNTIPLAEAAQASSSLRLLHSPVPQVFVAQEAACAGETVATAMSEYIGNEWYFPWQNATVDPSQEAARIMMRASDTLPLLAQTQPDAVLPVVAAPVMQLPRSQQSSITSVASRALDVRLQSPTPPPSTLAAACSSTSVAVSDIGRLATSALVAGRDVAPLGTVFNAGSPQDLQPQPQLLPMQQQQPQQGNVALRDSSYSFSTTPQGSPARVLGYSTAQGSSPPHSLSPPVLRGSAGPLASPQRQQPVLIYSTGSWQQPYVEAGAPVSPVQAVPSSLSYGGDVAFLADAAGAQPIPLQSAINSYETATVARAQPQGSGGPVVLSPTPPQQARAAFVQSADFCSAAW